MSRSERELSQVREEKEGLQQQCASLQKVVDKLRARVAELEAELAALRARHAKDHENCLVPFHHPSSIQFSEVMDVMLFSCVKGSTVYYTLDKSDPSPSNCAGSGVTPLKVTLRETTVVRAMCVTTDGQSGPASSETYTMREIRKQTTEASTMARAAPAPAPPPPVVPTVASRPITAVTAMQPPVVEAQPRPVVQALQAQPRNPLMAGVGMLLERFDGDDRVLVKRVVPGTPADDCGQIQIGDILLSGASSLRPPFAAVPWCWCCVVFLGAARLVAGRDVG
jgi:hypothetical protein